MNLNLLRLQRVRAAFAHEPLAILASSVEDIIGRLREYDFTDTSASDFLGEPSAEMVNAYYDARAAAGGQRQGTVAVVPVMGPITKRDSAMSMMLGGTSTTRLQMQLRQLAADDSVAAILLNVDSPGGTVSGMPELAAEIRRTRESKPVHAIVNDLGASAAYWAASQADTITATPESLTGSVGVFVEHTDCSQAMEQAGVATTYIYAGKYKVEGNPNEPLSDEARGHIQDIVDSAYAMFVADVAQGRGITAARVKSDYGEGRVLTAKDAKKAGMIDRIGTFNETVGRLSGLKPAGARAEGGNVEPGATYVVGEHGPETFTTSADGHIEALGNDTVRVKHITVTQADTGGTSNALVIKTEADPVTETPPRTSDPEPATTATDPLTYRWRIASA